MIFMATLALIHAADEKDKYTTKYDDINVDDIINSPRILKNYVNCILDKGPCTPEGTELKSKYIVFCKKILFVHYYTRCYTTLISPS